MDCDLNDDLFMGYSALEEITIPDGVTCICPNVFRFCDSLKKIRLEKDVSDVDALSFTARDLEAIEVDPKNVCFKSEDGILYNNDMSILLFCPYGKSGDVIIPDGVWQIGVDPMLPAFMDCRKVPSVYVPASVGRVFDEAFMRCSAKVTYRDRDAVEFFHAQIRYL